MKVQEDSDEKDEPETEEPTWKAGWNLREDHWYYCKEEGKLYLGWIKLKSKWYYLDGENAGIMNGLLEGIFWTQCKYDFKISYVCSNFSIC